MSAERSEPRFGRLRKDATVAVAGRGAAAVLSFAAVLLGTRLLDPAAYGDLAIVFVASSVAYALVASWNAPPVYVMAAEELAAHGTVRSTSTARLVVVASSTSVALVIGAVVVLVSGWDAPAGVVVATWAAATVGYLGCEHLTTLLETMGRYRSAAVVWTSRPLVYVVGLVLLLIRDNAGTLRAVLLCLTASWLVAVGLAAIYAVLVVPAWPPVTDRAMLRRLVSTSLPLVLYSVSQLVFGAVDLFFVRVFGAPDDVGYYGLAYQCFGVGVLLASAATPLLAPRLARTRADEPAIAAQYLGAVGRAVLPGGGVVAAVLVPLAPMAVRLVFGAEYAAAGPPLAVLVLALTLLVGSMTLGPLLLVEGRTHAIGRVAFAAVAVNATLDVVLLGVLDTGIIGAAWATTVAGAVTWFAYRRLVESMSDTRIVNGTTWLAPVLVAVTVTLLLPGWVALVCAALASLVALVVMWSRGAFDPAPFWDLVASRSSAGPPG